MASVNLSAEEGAVLTGVATVSSLALYGEFGIVPEWIRALAFLGLAASGYLGYTAYKTPASPSA